MDLDEWVQEGFHRKAAWGGLNVKWACADSEGTKVSPRELRTYSTRSMDSN
ncbi:hypothetical protein J6590_028085 [Homalodisca vitripennis]|nr:hypothetical protein J6590_028085 [Homalodisca vitripennis]